ncbi:MAG TPA: hypothetical protein VGH45_02790 [Solirubrobacteraceae bacterium]
MSPDDPADMADQAWLGQRSPNWTDNAWWQAQIDAALASQNSAISNLRITLLHQELSLALHRVTGTDSGANFHTWAVWGSRTAGRTIRREELPVSQHATALTAAILATAGAIAITRQGNRGRCLGGAAMAAAAATCLTNKGLTRASAAIFGGNATVLDDIGRQTARFVATANDPAEFEQFLAQLRSGPAIDRGQDLLRGAYRHYHRASQATDPDQRDELMLCANLLAILHEHQRLEPYLDESIPYPLRRLVTQRLLGFSVGAEAMRVSADVPTRSPSPFPETLRTIEDPELHRLLDGPQGWDRTPNTTDGSAARDWTQLSDRMNFIVDLFRTRQADRNLFTPPYTEQQIELIQAGQVPPGPL